MIEQETPAGLTGKGAVTAAEIGSQPQLWPKAAEIGVSASVLQERLVAGTTLYTGCGSTAHLARTLAFAHRQSLPTFAWSEVASEIWLAGDANRSVAETVVAISRSGETTETIQACLRAKQAGSTVVGVSTSPTSRLIEVCDSAVFVEFASEESVVQTRSFTSMLLAILSAQLSAAGQDAQATFKGVGEMGEALMTTSAPVVERLADVAFNTIYVLGSGLDAGLACEGALKIKEMSSTWCEGMPVLDFRHGPISLVDSQSAALVLCGPGLEHELAVAEDIESWGAFAATVGPDPRCTVQTPHGASLYSTAVARMVISQLAGLKRGISKGIDPDTPEGVPAFVEL
jgi:glucosamine--fructose-6-phosphate aminotransferase (isomerizing)